MSSNTPTTPVNNDKTVSAKGKEVIPPVGATQGESASQATPPVANLANLSLEIANSGAPTPLQPMEVDNVELGVIASLSAKSPPSGSAQSIHADPMRLALAAMEAQQKCLHELELAYARAATEAPFASETKELFRNFSEAQEISRNGWKILYTLKLALLSLIYTRFYYGNRPNATKPS